MDTAVISLDDIDHHLKEPWEEFKVWYRLFHSARPDQFPLHMPVIRWMMAYRGYQYLARVPDGEIGFGGVPEVAQSWYDLNITTRPFIVTVGEVVTVLFLAEMEAEAYEYVRRIRDLIGWPDGTDYDDGQMYHITMDYVRPTSSILEIFN
jgi:hypothetical protein